MPRPPRPTPLYSSIAAVSWPILRLAFRYRARGLENLPREGGYVLAAGHVSNLDPWALGLAIWPRRFLRFMGKSELFWPPLGWFLGACGAFPVRRGERAIYLTRTEHAILELLMRNGGRVVERDTLIASIWGGETDIESNTLDAFVRLLRSKVEQPGESKLIHTVRGVGYSLRSVG